MHKHLPTTLIDDYRRSWLQLTKDVCHLKVDIHIRVTGPKTYVALAIHRLHFDQVLFPLGLLGAEVSLYQHARAVTKLQRDAR